MLRTAMLLLAKGNTAITLTAPLLLYASHSPLHICSAIGRPCTFLFFDLQFVGRFRIHLSLLSSFASFSRQKRDGSPMHGTRFYPSVRAVTEVLVRAFRVVFPLFFILVLRMLVSALSIPV